MVGFKSMDKGTKKLITPKKEKMDKKNFFQTAGGLAVSAVLLFGTVWLISKAWTKGQKTA